MLPYEALGLEELLRHFSLGELLILSDFVTQKQAYVNTKKESINAIIKYGRSARDVLVHRQITKKSLVHYMVSNDIDFSIRRTKNALCDIILNFWREKYQRKSKCEDKGEIVLISSDDKEDRLLPVACTESHTYISIQVQESSSKSSVIEKYSTDNSKVIIPHGEESEMDIASPYLQKFGDTFTRWFFERWNSENASLNSIPDSVNGFGPHSFWDNASLMSLCIFPERACVEDQAAGAIAVAKKLSFYVKDQQLLFNPNISSDGIKVKSDVNGLLMVFVSGTVHRHDDCVGVFDQTFGLMKVPSMMYDEWKIKLVHLKIDVSNPYPKLEATGTSSSKVLDLDLKECCKNDL